MGFWNLSHKQTFFGNADQLVGFRLMPLEAPFRKALQAKWTHKVVDMNRRLVAFKDQSVGEVTAWKWDFGDGSTSTDQHPQHAYSRAGDFVVTLEVSGPAGHFTLPARLGRVAALIYWKIGAIEVFNLTTFYESANLPSSNSERLRQR